MDSGAPSVKIATGLAGGGVFHGNANREVITVPLLCPRHSVVLEFGIQPLADGMVPLRISAMRIRVSSANRNHRKALQYLQPRGVRYSLAKKVTVHGYVDRPELWPLQRAQKLGALLVVQASSLPSRPFVNGYKTGCIRSSDRPMTTRPNWNNAVLRREYRCGT